MVVFIPYYQVLERRIEPPFKPTVEQGLHDTSNFDEDIVKKRLGSSLLRKSPDSQSPLEQDNPFEGYSYTNPGLLAVCASSNSDE